MAQAVPWGLPHVRVTFDLREEVVVKQRYGSNLQRAEFQLLSYPKDLSELLWMRF